MGEDDILPNHTDIDIMEKSGKHIPFRRGQKMHVSTLRVFIHMRSPHGLLVVNMNSSTSMSSWLLFGSLNHSLCYLIIKILFSMIALQGIAFELINILATIFLCFNQTMMFMKRLSNLFWISLNLMWNLAFLFDLPKFATWEESMDQSQLWVSWH
jgi:hypothetical protein